MTAKEFLSQYRLSDLRIKAKLEQLEELRTQATHITPSYSEVACTPSASDKIGGLAAKITDLENEINADIDNLLNIRKEIVKAINTVEDSTLRTLLELRYINCKKWEQIAVEMDYTYQWICELHGRALKDIVLDGN